ncbi:hypothetical protein CWI49_12510, partial [Neisseria meningitidis]
HSHGGVKRTLHKKTKEDFSAPGHKVQENGIDAGDDVEAENEKFVLMGAVILEMPGWWGTVSFTHLTLPTPPYVVISVGVRFFR